ncbi:hypothetical protein TNIN_408341 [Trichonephila inaurata madagascariensis]|uniref:Uncharacterized protein n=1 Tax=Trichonephila inaurata madagascariensis TaxID=2747483 RepID=A0A8X6WQC8_9ARAC|nr:hypothetical protein TNIN_408341 [Trichonephila inaurata madagascariensis]
MFSWHTETGIKPGGLLSLPKPAPQPPANRHAEETCPPRSPSSRLSLYPKISSKRKPSSSKGESKRIIGSGSPKPVRAHPAPSVSPAQFCHPLVFWKPSSASLAIAILAMVAPPRAASRPGPSARVAPFLYCSVFPAPVRPPQPLPMEITCWYKRVSTRYQPHGPNTRK